MFTVKHVEYAGVDGVICKIYAVATSEGYLGKENFGLGIRVLPYHQKLVNEAKKMGWIQDRNLDLELRTGDHFLIYISKSYA